MERPRIFLLTKTTNSTDYEEVLSTTVSHDALGVSYFTLSVDPDPNALYQIIIGTIYNTAELEIRDIWTVELPHLTQGFYPGLGPGEAIIIRHRSKDPAITVETALTLAFTEVVAK